MHKNVEPTWMAQAADGAKRGAQKDEDCRCTCDPVKNKISNLQAAHVSIGGG